MSEANVVDNFVVAYALLCMLRRTGPPYAYAWRVLATFSIKMHCTYIHHTKRTARY